MATIPLPSIISDKWNQSFIPLAKRLVFGFKLLESIAFVEHNGQLRWDIDVRNARTTPLVHL
ncbi:hypothetical protein HUJ05_008253 [Dendroctonus ponderosae]|nr:hypothetical protein HUJ05_008253 [Dendroctonus ponderosae]